MQIIISGNGIELTEAIQSYVNKKIEGLDKFFDGIIRATVTVGMETHHHQNGDVFFAETKLEVPGYDAFAKETASTLYAAVDLLRDRLEGELKKYKAKLQGNEKKQKVAGRATKEYDGENDEYLAANQ